MVDDVDRSNWTEDQFAREGEKQSARLKIRIAWILVAISVVARLITVLFLLPDLGWDAELVIICVEALVLGYLAICLAKGSRAASVVLVIWSIVTVGVGAAGLITGAQGISLLVVQFIVLIVIIRAANAAFDLHRLQFAEGGSGPLLVRDQDVAETDGWSVPVNDEWPDTDDGPRQKGY